jgi:hypothetical protein
LRKLIKISVTRGVYRGLGCDQLLIALPIDEVSDLFLAKDLNGRAATFVRLEGPDKFIIQVEHFLTNIA